LVNQEGPDGLIRLGVDVIKTLVLQETKPTEEEGNRAIGDDERLMYLVDGMNCEQRHGLFGKLSPPANAQILRHLIDAQIRWGSESCEDLQDEISGQERQRQSQ